MEDNSDIKVCRTCLKEKTLDKFHGDAAKKGGYKYDCKKCFNENKRANYIPKSNKRIPINITVMGLRTKLYSDLSTLIDKGKEARTEEKHIKIENLIKETLKQFEEKKREIAMSNCITLLEKVEDDLIISVVQEWFVLNKKQIIESDNIIIEDKQNKKIIQLTKGYKITKEDHRDIVQIIRNRARVSN